MRFYPLWREIRAGWGLIFVGAIIAIGATVAAWRKLFRASRS
jgi:hypothetical protein